MRKYAEIIRWRGWLAAMMPRSCAWLLAVVAVGALMAAPVFADEAKTDASSHYRILRLISDREM